MSAVSAVTDRRYKQLSLLPEHART